MDRLHKVVDLLESLAEAGAPTMISSFQRAGEFSKLHTTLHPATASWPRVGNWNLSLTGSLLCPFLRGVYNNTEALGSFMECFTVAYARSTPCPPWFEDYMNLVKILAEMMDTCTPATYDALDWKSNSAEFINIIRTHEPEILPQPGEAGDRNLRRLLHGDVGANRSHPAQPGSTPIPTLPLQQILLQQADSALDADSPTEPMVFTSPSPTGPTSTDYTTDEEVKVEDTQRLAAMSEEADVRVPCTAPVAKEEEHKPRLIGGHQVRPPPDHQELRMRYPPRVRGE